MQKFYNPNSVEKLALLQRPTARIQDISSVISQVFDDVAQKGNKAIVKYIAKYDKAQLSELLVSQDEIDASLDQVSNELKAAIQLAKGNIEKFHKAQNTEKVSVETIKGVNCWQEKRPIQKVGLYIPGGTAPLFSTILMLAIPAQIAGCQEIILCTPSNEKGEINPAILYTANLCGIDKIFKVGGIQAIAGMTFGTETIPSVYKIFGPGNQYVTAAKQMATNYGVAIDMPAGPSELLILADDSANAKFVAADLLSQAEHGIDSQVILVSLSKGVIENVDKEINDQIEQLPRKEIARKSMKNAKYIYFDSNIEAMQWINNYAPEHFILCTKNNTEFLDTIHNAGSVFIGNYTPESAGDYASGTNHTLPTNGYAKNYSGVNLDAFTKGITFQEISKEGIQNIGNTIEIMAEAEGLYAHKNAVTLRLEEIKNAKDGK